MASAVLMDGYGSACVEALCDRTEGEIAERFPQLYRTDRFSPGYGDLPLEVQLAILEALNAGRQCGITITESLLMNPGKSVTALVGLADRPQGARIRGCGYCGLRKTCTIRKGGKTCAV